MKDTIAAISTSLGKGAISIVRVSGEDAIKMVGSIFTGKDLTKVPSHTIHYGFIKEKEELIDEVLVTVMKSPRTFTTEDIVEINCHGGIIATNRILETLLMHGARLAEAGEFTKRAFLNGRIDLTQAEAVMDLIESKSDIAHHQAIEQLNGRVSKYIEQLREKIKDLLASIEVNIDYPEYYDIEVITIDKIKTVSQLLLDELEKLLKDAQNGEIIKEGIKTVIIGRPNVGKSSILNSLLGNQKAIVTDIEGTTRDIVEGSISFEGIHLNIIDTAGIRQTEDKIEKIGVEKSLSLMKEANLILLVLNSGEKLTEQDYELLEKVELEKTIVVLNKNDLDCKLELEKLKKYQIVSTNTKDLQGLSSLKEKIKELFNLEKIESGDTTYLSNARQISLVKKAKKSIEEALSGIENGLPIDMITIDLHQAFDLLGEIIGQEYSEEIMDHLFANFCVGK